MRGSSAANLQVAGIRKVSGSDQYDHQSRTQKMSVQRLHDDYLEGITEDSSNKQRFLSSELVKNTLSSNILKTESVNVSNANVSEFSEHGNVPNLDPSIPRLSNELKGWYVPAVSGITNSQSEDVKVLPASSFDPDHSVMSMLSCHSNQSPILKVEAEANSSSSFACSNKVLPSPPTVKVAQDRSFPARALPSTCSPVASAGSEGSTYCPFASACFQDSAHCPVMSAVVQGLAHSPVTSSGFQDLALPKVLADKVSRCRISLPSANVKQQSVPSDIRKPGEPCGQSELSHRKPPQSRRYYKKMVSVGVQCRCLFIPLIKTEPLDSDNEVSPAVSSNLGSRRRLSDNDNVPDHGVMSDDSRRNIMCESEIGFIGVLPSKQRDNNASMRSLSDDVSGKGSKMNEQISGPVIRDFGSKRFSEHSTPMIVDPAHGDVGSELDTVGLEMDVSCDDLTDGESSGLGEILDADSFGDDSLANMLGDASRIGRPSFHENEGDAISEATTIVKSEEVSPKSSSCEKRKILSGSTQGEVVKEPPAKRKRGRPPGRKVAQSFQVVENEKEISSGSGLDKLAPGDVLKETPARRKRGRPPGRKIAQSFQVVENEKEISSGSGLDKLAPGDVLKETPARRKRGRPPGRKIAQSFQVVENKKEITSGSGLDKLAPGDVLKETPARRKRGRPPGKKVELSFQVVENKKEITSGSGPDELDEEGLQPVILQSGRKRFGCQHCSKCFSTAIQCSLHEKEAHVLLTCDECAETFSCEAEVQKHYNLKHKGKYVRFSKEIPEGESDDNFEVPDDIESSSASDNDYVDPEYVDKQEEGEDLDDALSQHKTSSASMRKRRKGMMDKRNHNSVTKVVCKCGRTYQKNHAKRHLETRMHKSFEDARKLKIKDRGNETSLHKSFEDARKLKIKKLRKRREGIRKVCSKIKSLLQRKQLAPSTQSTSTYVYCLKVKETTFNNCIKGFVQLKQELTSKEQRKLQKELQENLEEIHKRVRENVSYQSEEALDNGELSNAESLEDSTGITRDNQLSSCTGSANNGNQIGTRVANRSQLSDFIADTSGQLNPVANSSDQQSPGIFDTSDKLFCCTAGASDYLHVSTSTHLANSSGQLSQDMGNNSDTLGTCNVVASDKLSADNADTSVKPSDNGESCDSRSDAYTCMSDKLENSGNSANYPEDCDSKDDTNPSFLVDFFRCEVFRHCLSKSKKRGKERPSGFLFNVIFDSLEKETLFPISEKLYNSLRVCLHHRYHEMCPIGKKENLSVGSKISDVWAGHLDTRDIDRDGVLQMLGKIDYSSKISVDSWKIVKPMEKGKDFCYSLLVVDKTHKNKHRIVSDGVTGFLLTQQEITDLSSVESLIKKSLKQFDIFHRRFSHTITTSPDKLRTEQNVGDLAEAQRGEKGMTLVQEERCIAGKTAISGICPQGGEEDSSEKGRGKSTTNSETSTVDPADTRDSEHRPEEMMVSADDTSVLDIDYSVTLSKYCKCCYIECMKRSQRTRRYCFSFNFSSISIDGNNLDDITLKIYKSLLVTRFRGIFLNNFFTVAQMKEVIQNLWDNKCDISVPELLLMYKVREKGLFWCDECQVTLANEVEVAKHLGQSCHLISGQSNKLCPICGKSFKGNILFLRHRITKHHHAVLLPLMPGAIKRCPHCQKPFYNSTALNRHIQYVHQGTNTKPVEPVEPVEPVLCNECGKLLQTKEGVVKHKRWHYNEKKRMSSGVIPCPYCSKTVRACKFCQHLETHENTKQYCCEICKKRFKIKCALTMHMKIHSDVREFTCPECGQEFRHKAHMQSHLRRHTGDLFECQLCERTFTIKTNLKIHLRKRHPEHQKAEIYTCKFCCEEFMRLTDLNRHIDVEHMSSSKAGDSDRIDKPTTSLDGRLFECNHCNKKFAKKYYLRKHICSAHQDGVNDKNNVKSSRTQKLDKVIKDKKAVKIKMLKSAEVSFDKDGNVTKRKRETAGKKQRKCNMPNDGAPRNTEEKKLAKRKVSETRGS
ncbi:uncharacterized protein LOC135491004 isoform X2 [Lineus longissimus]|uniref:uncharacterized protein LOC135491004 isoform X2 n=1 Tax=Lineus longissimus TaxID=88925 RepID=UPI00315D658C